MEYFFHCKQVCASGGEAIFVFDLGAVPHSVVGFRSKSCYSCYCFAAFLSGTAMNCSITLELYQSEAQQETDDRLETGEFNERGALTSWGKAVTTGGGGQMHIQLETTLQGGSPYFSSQNHLGFPLIELNWKLEDFGVIHKSAAWEQNPTWR